MTSHEAHALADQARERAINELLAAADQVRAAGSTPEVARDLERGANFLQTPAVPEPPARLSPGMVFLLGLLVGRFLAIMGPSRR
jgi:hypothetical protein